MKFVCLSDTHNRHRAMAHDVPDGDVLLHAGDFSMIGKPAWIRDFNDWLGTLPHKHKIVIAGNHDISFDESKYPEGLNVTPADYESLLTNATYLRSSSVTVGGFKIWGEPRQPEFFNWAFNVRRDLMESEVWSNVPEDVDILLTHGPPEGYGDLAKDLHGPEMINVGCSAQKTLIENRPSLRAVVCGHIHGGHGVYDTGTGVKVLNASICTEDYHPLNPPLVFEL